MNMNNEFSTQAGIRFIDENKCLEAVINSVPLENLLIGDNQFPAFIINRNLYLEYLKMSEEDRNDYVLDMHTYLCGGHGIFVAFVINWRYTNPLFLSIPLMPCASFVEAIRRNQSFGLVSNEKDQTIVVSFDNAEFLDQPLFLANIMPVFGVE